MKTYKLLTSAALTILLAGNSAMADSDAFDVSSRDAYLMGINWSEDTNSFGKEPGLRTNYLAPVSHNPSTERPFDVSSRDDYLMGVNWTEDSNSFGKEQARINYLALNKDSNRAIYTNDLYVEEGFFPSIDH